MEWTYWADTLIILYYGPDWDIYGLFSILRTGVVAAVAVFFLASFSQPILAETFMSTSESARSEQVNLLFSKLMNFEYAEANEILELLQKKEPQAYEWQYLKGQMHDLLHGDVESARSVFAELIRTNPLQSRSYKGLLICASGSKELAEIKDMIDEAMKSAKGETLREFKVVCAFYHIRVGEYDEAFRIYDQLLSEDPEDLTPYMYKGHLYNELKQYEEADKCSEKFLSSLPEGDCLFPRQFFADNFVKHREIFRNTNQDSSEKPNNSRI